MTLDVTRRHKEDKDVSNEEKRPPDPIYIYVSLMQIKTNLVMQGMCGAKTTTLRSVCFNFLESSGIQAFVFDEDEALRLKHTTEDIMAEQVTLKTKHLPAHALQRKETNSQKNHVCVPLD
jgi:hypothetical protein